MKITVYEKPTCTTCRNLATLFRENGIDYDKVNYFIEPFTADKLRDLVRKTGLRPYELLRKGDQGVKDAGITEASMDEEIISLMEANPNVIQRPIVEVGEKAVLARPIDKALELINK